MEQIKYKNEQIKLDLELQKLALIRSGKMSASALNEELVSSRFDVASNLLLLPKFNENDIDTFFCLFERVADSRGWPDEDRTLMLQCVFTGKAQEAYYSTANIDYNKAALQDKGGETDNRKRQSHQACNKPTTA